MHARTSLPASMVCTAQKAIRALSVPSVKMAGPLVLDTHARNATTRTHGELQSSCTGPLVSPQWGAYSYFTCTPIGHPPCEFYMHRCFFCRSLVRYWPYWPNNQKDKGNDAKRPAEDEDKGYNPDQDRAVLDRSITSEDLNRAEAAVAKKKDKAKFASAVAKGPSKFEKFRNTSKILVRPWRSQPCEHMKFYHVSVLCRSATFKPLAFFTV